MEIVCSSCGTQNTLLDAKALASAVCEQCQNPLAPNKLVELTDANFLPFLGGTDAPVLVYFYAPHCATCRSVGPRFEELAKKTPQLLAAKLNTVSQYRTVQAIGLRGIPALALYHQGKQVALHAGNISAPDMQTWLEGALKIA